MLALFLFLLLPGAVFGQTGSTPPVCDPLPTDITELEACIEYWAYTPSIYNDITSVPGVSKGVHGMSAAYDPINDRMLFASTDGVHVYAQLYNANGGQNPTQVGPIFRVDQGNLYGGAPRVMFNAGTQHYFAVWADARPGRSANGDGSVYGRFIDANGNFVGNDFPIHNTSNMALSDFAFDSFNQRYLVMVEGGENSYLKTIMLDGTVSALIPIAVTSVYEGQSSVIYNPDRNEYWFTYLRCTLNDTAQEDCRVMFVRMDTASMQMVGEVVQVSQVNLGHNRVGGPQIEYSTTDHAAVIVWNEGMKNPGMITEIYGRTVYNDLALSSEYPVLAAQTAQTSNFYGGGKSLVWNPYTNTFMVAGEDNNGGTTGAEFLSDGTVLAVKEMIPHTPGSNGNFNPSITTSQYGAYVYTTVNYGSPVIATYNSPFVYTPPAPQTINQRPVVDLDTTNVAKAMTQIYVWSLGLAGLLAVVMVIVGGYLVMSARGNGQQVATGKEYVIGALTGLVLLLGAYLILNTINPDLVNFDLSGLNVFK